MSHRPAPSLSFTLLHPEKKPSSWSTQVLAELQTVDGVQPASGQPPDFILNLTPNPASCPSSGPRLGVWSLHLDPPGRYLRTGSLRQTTPDGTVTLERRIFPAAVDDPTALTLLADAPAKACRLFLADTPFPPVAENPVPDLPPSGAALRLAGQLRNTLLTEIWQVGLVNASIERFLDPGFRPQVHWLANANPAHFYADPFLAPEEDSLRILVEEYDYRTDPVGRIGELFWTGGRFHPPACRILPALPHMSYPFLFSSQGTLYCIPETWQQGRIQLHRFQPDTGTWSEGVTLLPGVAAVDTTVVHYQDRWWLFCTEKGPAVDCRLLLWHAPHLDGPWVPHPANPVKVDIRSARPGGTPFLAAGTLYRPAQDCSESYGCRLSINRIDKLTPTAFEEVVVRVLNPFPDWPCRDGWHTLSGAGDWTLLDAKRMTFLPDLAARRLRHKFQRLTRTRSPAC